MCDDNIASRFMIDFAASGLRQEIGDVLNQRSMPVHVQTLETITDPQHGFAMGIRIVQ